MQFALFATVFGLGDPCSRVEAGTRQPEKKKRRKTRGRVAKWRAANPERVRELDKRYPPRAFRMPDAEWARLVGRLALTVKG